MVRNQWKEREREKVVNTYESEAIRTKKEKKAKAMIIEWICCGKMKQKMIWLIKNELKKNEIARKREKKKKWWWLRMNEQMKWIKKRTKNNHIKQARIIDWLANRSNWTNQNKLIDQSSKSIRMQSRGLPRSQKEQETDNVIMYTDDQEENKAKQLPNCFGAQFQVQRKQIRNDWLESGMIRKRWVE